MNTATATRWVVRIKTRNTRGEPVIKFWAGPNTAASGKVVATSLANAKRFRNRAQARAAIDEFSADFWSQTAARRAVTVAEAEQDALDPVSTALSATESKKPSRRTTPAGQDAKELSRIILESYAAIKAVPSHNGEGMALRLAHELIARGVRHR